MPAHVHTYGTPSYTWADDNSTCTASVTCTAADCDCSDGATVTETVNTTSETTPATCESKGKTVYTATFTNELFETQTKEVKIDAAGHEYGEPTYEWADDNSTCTATVTCTKADCDHGENATVTETVNTTSETTPATCESKGKTVYTATFTNELFTQQTKTVDNIDATGHKYGEPEWTWNEDYTEASATFTCANNAEHVETVAAEITSERTEPTFEAEGKIVYTAKVTFGETEYKDEKTVVLDKLEYTFPDDSNDFSAEQGKDFVLAVKRSVDDDRTFDLFEKLLIDEKEVAKTNYTLQKGSVIITLKGEFIKTISAGEHTVKVVFSDGGVVEHTLTVKASSTSPKTADEASLALYVVMAAAAMTAMAGVVVVQRKRKEQ